MSASIEARALGYSHGPRAVLQEVSFWAAAGEFVALLGVNGAGKSTLLDVLAGLREAGSGEVWIAGRPRRAWSGRELARRVSHLPQAIHADLPFTAGQVVAMGRYPHTDSHFEGVEDQRLIQAAMERTGSAGYAARAFGSLSGGERQRVLLASCLAQDAEVLLLDEPSTFLDVGAQLDCFALLRDEAARGRLCIAVTHDLNLALAHCTRLLVLAGGVILHDLPVREAGADAGWLRSFSPRLRLGSTDAGAARVWYR